MYSYNYYNTEYDGYIGWLGGKGYGKDKGKGKGKFGGFGGWQSKGKGKRQRDRTGKTALVLHYPLLWFLLPFSRYEPRTRLLLP